MLPNLTKAATTRQGLVSVQRSERRGSGSTTVLGMAVNELGVDVRALGCGGVSSDKVVRYEVEPVLLSKKEGVWVSDRTLG
jgi:Asp/Glu/hydantoin racemase